MFSLRNIGSPELIIVAVLILLFFGGKKLSQFGSVIRESKDEIKNIKKELEKTDDEKGDESGGGS